MATAGSTFCALSCTGRMTTSTANRNVSEMSVRFIIGSVSPSQRLGENLLCVQIIDSVSTKLLLVMDAVPHTLRFPVRGEASGQCRPNLPVNVGARNHR